MFDISSVFTNENLWRDTEVIEVSVLFSNWRPLNILYSWPVHCEFTKVQKSHTSVSQW